MSFPAIQPLYDQTEPLEEFPGLVMIPTRDGGPLFCTPAVGRALEMQELLPVANQAIKRWNRPAASR